MSVWDKLHDIEVDISTMRDNISKLDDKIADMVTDVDNILNELRDPNVNIKSISTQVEQVYLKLNEVKDELY